MTKTQSLSVSLLRVHFLGSISRRYSLLQENTCYSWMTAWLPDQGRTNLYTTLHCTVKFVLGWCFMKFCPIHLWSMIYKILPNLLWSMFHETLSNLFWDYIFRYLVKAVLDSYFKKFCQFCFQSLFHENLSNLFCVNVSYSICKSLLLVHVLWNFIKSVYGYCAHILNVLDFLFTLHNVSLNSRNRT